MSCSTVQWQTFRDCSGRNLCLRAAIELKTKRNASHNRLSSSSPTHFRKKEGQVASPQRYNKAAAERKPRLRTNERQREKERERRETSDALLRMQAAQQMVSQSLSRGDDHAVFHGLSSQHDLHEEPTTDKHGNDEVLAGGRNLLTSLRYL